MADYNPFFRCGKFPLVRWWDPVNGDYYGSGKGLIGRPMWLMDSVKKNWSQFEEKGNSILYFWVVNSANNFSELSILYKKIIFDSFLVYYVLFFVLDLLMISMLRDSYLILLID